MKTSKHKFNKTEAQNRLSELQETYNSGDYKGAFLFLKNKVKGGKKREIDVSELVSFVKQNIPSPQKNESTYQTIFHHAIDLKNGEESCNHGIEELKAQFQFEKVGRANAMEFLSRIDELVRALPDTVRYNSHLPITDEIGAHALHSLLVSLDEQASVSLSEELKRCLVMAWCFYYDQHLLKRMLDDVLFGSCYLNENSKYLFNEWYPKSPKFQYFNRLKSDFRWRILQKAHKTDVDGEAHFQKVDPELKTNEGIALLAISGGSVVQSSLPEGGTWLQLNDEEGSSKEKSAAFGMAKMYKQHFHTYYRRWLQQFYEPKEFDTLKKQKIEYNNDTFTAYELISLSSFIMAASEMLCNNPLFAHPALVIKDLLKRICDEEGAKTISVAEIVQLESGFPVSEKLIWPLTFGVITEKVLFVWARKINDFEDWDNEKLRTLFNYFVSNNLHQGFYKIEGKFAFNSHAILTIDYAGFIHQRIVSSALYSNKSNNQSNTNARNREKEVIAQMKALFEKRGFAVLVNHKYSFEIKDEKMYGEMDLLVLSEKEKTGLILELKLSNSGAFDTRSQYTWAERHLTKAKSQLLKDIAYLNQVKKEKQGIIENQDITRYRLRPLILTDHFFYDHLAFPLFPNKRLITQVVSTFELRCLLDEKLTQALNQDVVAPANSLKELLLSIHKNSFWNNVLPKKWRYKKTKSKSLKASMLYRY